MMSSFKRRSLQSLHDNTRTAFLLIRTRDLDLLQIWGGSCERNGKVRSNKFRWNEYSGLNDRSFSMKRVIAGCTDAIALSNTEKPSMSKAGSEEDLTILSQTLSQLWSLKFNVCDRKRMSRFLKKNSYKFFFKYALCSF